MLPRSYQSSRVIRRVAALLQTISLYEPELCVLSLGCVEEHRTLINISS